MLNFLIKHLYKKQNQQETISITELKEKIVNVYNGKHYAYLIARLNDFEDSKILKSSVDSFLIFLQSQVCDMLNWSLFISEKNNYDVITIQKTYDNSFYYVEFQSSDLSFIDAYDIQDNYAVTDLTDLDKICTILKKSYFISIDK